MWLRSMSLYNFSNSGSSMTTSTAERRAARQSPAGVKRRSRGFYRTNRGSATPAANLGVCDLPERVYYATGIRESFVILCQFDDHRLGLAGDGLVRDVTPVLDGLPGHRYPCPPGDALIASLPTLRASIQAAAAKAQPVPLSQVRLLSPIGNPGKVMGAPVNYQKHLDEVTSDPGLHHQNKAHMQAIHQSGLFLMASSSVVGPSQGIVIRHPDRRTDHEVELAVVIGKPAKAVAAKDALGFVAGYCIGLDITVRGPEERSLRKSIDTYTVLGPWMVTADEIPDPSNLDLWITVNGELRQKANTRDMILGIPELIEFASSFYTLWPGDVLLSGTPEGVGPIRAGDVLHAHIDHIGAMEVHVRNV
jgi:2,4-didehydro-3-deoxy-L-rhamnonate hydrolase